MDAAALLRDVEPKRDADTPTVFYQVLPPCVATPSFNDTVIGVLGGLPAVPWPGHYGKDFEVAFPQVVVRGVGVDLTSAPDAPPGVVPPSMPLHLRPPRRVLQALLTAGVTDSNAVQWAFCVSDVSLLLGLYGMAALQINVVHHAWRFPGVAPGQAVEDRSIVAGVFTTADSGVQPAAPVSMPFQCVDRQRVKIHPAGGKKRGRGKQRGGKAPTGLYAELLAMVPMACSPNNARLRLAPGPDGGALPIACFWSVSIPGGGVTAPGAEGKVDDPAAAEPGSSESEDEGGAAAAPTPATPAAPPGAAPSAAAAGAGGAGSGPPRVGDGGMAPPLPIVCLHWMLTGGNPEWEAAVRSAEDVPQLLAAARRVWVDATPAGDALHSAACDVAVETAEAAFGLRPRRAASPPPGTEPLTRRRGQGGGRRGRGGGGGGGGAPHSIVGDFVCAACLAVKPASAFSKSQINKHADRRRCKACLGNA